MSPLFALDPAQEVRMDAVTPSREVALSRAAQVRPGDYARTRNHLQGAVSGLSPYVTHGVLTLPEVLAQVLQRGPLPITHKWVYELGWRAFFRQVWLHQGDGILSSLHPGPLPDEAYAQTLPADIRQACTGVPVVDEAVRTLYSTGTLHNHARMWLASYVVHVRRVHWRAGADWMVAHLLDGDLASNHLSWQWVAGTGSHKPYLFNAENVAKFAPAEWHSRGTVIDQSYEALDRLARGVPGSEANGPQASAGGTKRWVETAEPALYGAPPAALGWGVPDDEAMALLRGREVWLVHPWAVRRPPTDVSEDAVVVGVYCSEYHRAWPWTEQRWQWVDAAMAEVTPHRWHVDVPTLARALSGAARVRGVQDPHIAPYLAPVAELEAPPRLFPALERPYSGFSKWWAQATRGLHEAGELL